MTKIPKLIYEEKSILKFLASRGLLEQYVRSCRKVLSSNINGANFKQRKGTGTGVRSFRINKQFRAIGYWRGDDLVIVKIDNHQ